MSLSRPSVARLTLSLAALATAAPLGAQQRDAYPATLYFGTGLITIPTAWVSPRSLDMWVQTAGKTIPYFIDESKHSIPSKWNTNISLDVHFGGRASVGVSAYSQNPEVGFFGQALLLRDRPETFLPGVAIGVRNVGYQVKCQDRYLSGHDIQLQGDSTYDNICSKPGFKSSPTVYGVVSKDFSFGGGNGGRSSTFGLSVGYGNGLFIEDGDRGDEYNESGTIVEGLFLGGRFAFHPTLNTTINVLAENDAWDYNAGVVADYRGISFGFYVSEIEAGSDKGGPGERIYNYMKYNLSLGYSGNIIDISRGIILRARISELTREQQRLRMEIAQRERRIRALEGDVRKAQAGELTEITRRRQQIESEVQAERDAIRRATERLEQIERGGPPPPPPSTPPGVTSTPPQQ